MKIFRFHQNKDMCINQIWFSNGTTCFIPHIYSKYYNLIITNIKMIFERFIKEKQLCKS